MTIEQLREVHRAQPFRPFTLELADGQKVHVPHPEFLWHLPGGRTVFVAVSDEAAKIIDLLLAVLIHIENGQPPKQRRRKR